MEDLEVQQEFFNTIKSKLPKNFSLVEEVADVLGISNDSVYRRMRGEKELSLHEIKLLCGHFKMSLDQIFSIQSDSFVFHGNLIEGESFNFNIYLNDILNNLNSISQLNEKTFYYEAKDIPPFHYFFYSHLSSFKFYFWQKLILQENESGNKMFNPSEYKEIFEQTGRKISQVYCDIPSVEIWHQETINSTLRQIEFCRDSRLFNNDYDLQLLYEELDMLITHIEDQAACGGKFIPGNEPPEGLKTFSLHVNEVLLGHNTMLCYGPEQKFVYLNHNVLNFMITYDQKFSEYTYHSLQNVIRKSNLISEVNEKSRNIFFNKIRKRLEKSRNGNV